MLLFVFSVYFFLWAAQYVILWKIFVKANKPGWTALIPIYNWFILVQVANCSFWWLAFILLFKFFFPFLEFVLILLLTSLFITNKTNRLGWLFFGLFLLNGMLSLNYKAYKIPTGSMIPTFIINDRFLANRIQYHIPLLDIELPSPLLVMPKRGDIVIFQYPGYHSPGKLYKLFDYITANRFHLNNSANNPRDFIKRLIGLPGDIIAIKNKQIQINNKKIVQNNNINSGFLSKLLDIKLNANSNSSYYENRDGRLISQYNETVLIEKGEDTQYTIQLIADLKSESIPFLYIPKKGDKIEFKIVQSKEKGIWFRLILNGNNLGQLPLNIFLRFYEKLFYSSGDAKKNHFELTFTQNYYFMMGDNRDNSEDSRHWGFVAEEKLIALPLFIYYPLERINFF